MGRGERKRDLRNPLHTMPGVQGPALKQSLHVGVFFQERALQTELKLRDLLVIETLPMESTDASHPLLLPYFKQLCHLGWSGFLISTLHIRQLRSKQVKVSQEAGCRARRGAVEAKTCWRCARKSLEKSLSLLPLYC